MRKLPTKSVRMWLARGSTGKLRLYNKKPTKNKYGTWSTVTYNFMLLDDNLFPNVKWEDKEPTRVSLRLV